MSRGGGGCVTPLRIQSATRKSWFTLRSKINLRSASCGAAAVSRGALCRRSGKLSARFDRDARPLEIFVYHKIYLLQYNVRFFTSFDCLIFNLIRVHVHTVIVSRCYGNGGGVTFQHSPLILNQRAHPEPLHAGCQSEAVDDVVVD
ncbi:hypothetical protein EVAR_16428_1 [Eumeta japonica]|uniref:Uncharacterized protein n=1 Tax=Eumeta variegata TaxID=151549 RepID=A0A4C1UK84_EUMVA|nr:hypothetical protein EVAR_16428_1 [Eumeta japonica]